MAYTKSPRPYKREWQLEKKRDEKKSRATRARARRLLDKKLPDKNKNGKADKREGKDIAHKKALSKGGKNKDGLVIQTKSKNRSFKRNSAGKLVSEKSKRERKKKTKKK
jgi:hypothetical protein|tara:strand:- start:249 stop:575 length:327 start_codon:yes stop_codon:yes gene_type:complete